MTRQPMTPNRFFTGLIYILFVTAAILALILIILFLVNLCAQLWHNIFVLI